jgi:thiamine kinase-like enzyme/nicotinamidase-related amidase
MKAVLITQCLQNDFVKPIASGEPLPNQLHIGHNESRRLVGDNKANGPVGRFMSWVDRQSAQQLSSIHIRDWHNPECDQQKSHLAQFGQHCIQGTVGAEFIFDVSLDSPLDASLKDSVIVNSTTLNDFEGTALSDHLNQCIQNNPSSEKIRLGLIGVWTEAKILFLAYELSTRYPHCDIAVCSALTASSSRSQHFLALQQLERVVGVTVIDSIGEFIQFLGGKETATQHKNLNQSLNIHYSDQIASDDETDHLIRYLFRDCKKITLKVLDGGFSGNIVAGVNSIDVHGHEQASHVIKIGPRDLMAKERTAFEQIETVLGNNAPAIAEYADGHQKGAIKYRYASMGAGSTRSLQECFHAFFEGTETLHNMHQHLDAVFDEQLSKLYRAAVNDSQNLFDYYCFDSQWAGSIKNKIEELIGHCPEEDALLLPGNKTANNLYKFYQQDLNQIPPIVSDFPFSFIHGDLNGANIIIDGKDNVWLIDFFHTHRGHVLKDFAKLENDLLYIYTPINNENDLQSAYCFTDFLINLYDPFETTAELPAQFIGTQFDSAWQVIKKIRTMAGQYINKDAPYRKEQWLLPQLRYAVHTIGFDEPNEWQRVWALYTAAVVAEQMVTAVNAS